MNTSVRYNAELWMLRVNRYADAADHLRATNGLRHLPESVLGIAFKNFGLALMYFGHIAEAACAETICLGRAPGTKAVP